MKILSSIPMSNHQFLSQTIGIYAINLYTASARKSNNAVVNSELNILQIFLGMKPQALDQNT
jgi:hypothetical protein